MKKVLCEFGVYPYLGSSIPNYIELGLSPDKVYSVLKDGDFVNAEGKFVGVVPQKDPLDVSIQINAYNINETKI